MQGEKNNKIMDIVMKGLKYSVDENDNKIQTKQDAIDFLISKVKIVKNISMMIKKRKYNKKK